MNCLFEGVCSLFMYLRERVVPAVEGRELDDARTQMESCKTALESRERVLLTSYDQLGRNALARRNASDTVSARRDLCERRRVMEKIERVRACISVVDKQLDAIQSRELNQELFNSLRLSNKAMKRTGATGDVDEAEKIMGELDDQLAHSMEFTSVISTPLEGVDPGFDVGELDLEAELGLLEVEYMPSAAGAVGAGSCALPVRAVPSTSAPVRVAPPVSTSMRPDADASDESTSLLPATGLSLKRREGRRPMGARFAPVPEESVPLAASGV